MKKLSDVKMFRHLEFEMQIDLWSASGLAPLPVELKNSAAGWEKLSPSTLTTGPRASGAVAGTTCPVFA